MVEIIKNIYVSFVNLNASDKILFVTFLAILWYSWETRQLRKWQIKQVQLTLLDLHLSRQIADEDHHSRRFFPFGEDYVRNLREIMELGKFDAKTLFSSSFHYPLTRRAKVREFIKKTWGKILNFKKL